jgi:hypothetical protein
MLGQSIAGCRWRTEPWNGRLLWLVRLGAGRYSFTKFLAQLLVYEEKIQ